MNHKNSIILSIIFAFSCNIQAMSPHYYTHDNSGCVQGFHRGLGKLTYLVSYYCRSHTPDHRIYLAVRENNPEKLQSALNDGGNIDQGGDLIGLCAYAPTKHIALLLEHKANPNIINEWGETPAGFAIVNGNTHALAILMQYGVLPDQSLYQLAKQWKQSNCLKVLKNAALLRQAKIDEDNKRARILFQEHKQKEKEFNDSVKQQLTSVYTINDTTVYPLISLAKPELTAQEIALQQQQDAQKLELEKEQERIEAKRKETYLKEFNAGKEIARQKREQLKHAKHK